MRFILAASFVAVFIATTVKVETTDTNTSCTTPFNKIMLCNLMCNLLQDSQTNAAMKTIQTKLENLITVVNKPPPPGKVAYVLAYQIQSVKRKENARSLACKIVLPFSGQEMTTLIKQRFFLELKKYFTLFRYFLQFIPVSSCKEQYEKYS